MLEFLPAEMSSGDELTTEQLERDKSKYR
jgi:hypothetical protein